MITMLRYFFLILLIFSFNPAFNQGLNQIEKDLNEHGLKLSIAQEKPSGVHLLKIHDTKNNSIKSFRMDNDIDRYIAASYFGDRKFVIIGGRYSFYIIDISRDSLIGPFQPTPREERVDGQSGALHSLSLLNNAQYLILGAIDNGVYCYNLSNINKPFEIELFHPESKYFKSEFFFLDKSKENTYSGIVSSLKRNKQERWEIASRFLFQQYHLKENSENKIIKKQIENRYLLLHRLIDKDSTENIVVDYDKGKLLNSIEYKELIKQHALEKE